VAADEGGSSSESTRPGAAQWLPLDVDKKQGREKLRAFRCSACKRWRVRSRWDEGRASSCTNCDEPVDIYCF